MIDPGVHRPLVFTRDVVRCKWLARRVLEDKTQTQAEDGRQPDPVGREQWLPGAAEAAERGVGALC